MSLFISFTVLFILAGLFAVGLCAIAAAREDAHDRMIERSNRYARKGK